MNIEETRLIVEVSEYYEANNYLQLGWVLINQYVRDFSELGHASQRPFYVLAWQKRDSEPQHPTDPTFLQNKRTAEMWDARRVI